MVTGAFAQANMFGSMLSILGSINKKNHETMTQLEETAKVMKNMKLPEKLQQDISEYIVMT